MKRAEDEVWEAAVGAGGSGAEQVGEAVAEAEELVTEAAVAVAEVEHGAHDDNDFGDKVVGVAEDAGEADELAGEDVVLAGLGEHGGGVDVAAAAMTKYRKIQGVPKVSGIERHCGK